MKKEHRNWYLWDIPLVVIIGLILLFCYIGDKPHHYVNSILGAFGALHLLEAVLTKIGCIANPFDGSKVCEDKTIERNVHFYLDLVTAILYFLGFAINWFMQHGLFGFSFTICIVLSFRLVCTDYAKKLYKDK